MLVLAIAIAATAIAAAWWLCRATRPPGTAALPALPAARRSAAIALTRPQSLVRGEQPPALFPWAPGQDPQAVLAACCPDCHAPAGTWCPPAAGGVYRINAYPGWHAHSSRLQAAAAVTAATDKPAPPGSPGQLAA